MILVLVLKRGLNSEGLWLFFWAIGKMGIRFFTFCEFILFTKLRTKVEIS